MTVAANHPGSPPCICAKQPPYLFDMHDKQPRDNAPQGYAKLSSPPRRGPQLKRLFERTRELEFDVNGSISASQKLGMFFDELEAQLLD